MEENLLKKSLEWYKSVIDSTKNRTGGEDPHVQVNGKYINTFNDLNEDVPVLYTRDYILGHYEGDTVDDVGLVKDEWIDSDSTAYLAYNKPQSKITKLSWLRIDNLIWEALEEVLSGKVRHV
jgi:hypothetical protein